MSVLCFLAFVIIDATALLYVAVQNVFIMNVVDHSCIEEDNFPLLVAGIGWGAVGICLHHLNLASFAYMSTAIAMMLIISSSLYVWYGDKGYVGYVLRKYRLRMTMNMILVQFLAVVTVLPMLIFLFVRSRS
ncbi:MAG: hypothetical protein ACPG1C_08620 [Alphaproteobacteria bacterium]